MIPEIEAIDSQLTAIRLEKVRLLHEEMELTARRMQLVSELAIGQVMGER